MGLPSAMAQLPPNAVILGGGPALPPGGATDSPSLNLVSGPPYDLHLSAYFVVARFAS